MKKIKKYYWSLSHKINRSFFYPLCIILLLTYLISFYPFAALEGTFYDLRIRADLPFKNDDLFVLVTLDEESEDILGERYPYTLATHGKFLRNILPDRPQILSYLVAPHDPAGEQEEDDLEDFKNKIIHFQKKGGIFRFGTTMDSWGEILPAESLRPLGYSLAVLNVDNASFTKDEICRRGILTIAGEESLHLWLANEYLKSQGLPPKQISDIPGATYDSKANATFSNFRYGLDPTLDKNKLTTIPFYKVIVGDFPKGFFTHKIILVGPQYASRLQDYVLTPFNKEDIYGTTQLSTHAVLIQSLIENRMIYPLPKIYTKVACFVIVILLSWMIFRSRPTTGLIVALSSIIGTLLASYILFVVWGVWVYFVPLLITIFMAYYVWFPFKAIKEYQIRFLYEEETKILKKVEHLKKNFLSLMSHDLKTPVAKISGICDLLIQHYKLEGEVRDHVKVMFQATKELNQFITTILDLSKIESEKVLINKTSKDLNNIIEAVISELCYESKEFHVSLQKELAPLYPIQIDSNLIKRVVSNLVENAIKYAGQHSVIRIKTWEDPTWVYMEVSDNGIGIAPDHLEHIFEKFYRVKREGLGQIKGTGLGLYLVKYFIELHGGVINVRSQLGKGTAFTVKFSNR
jgi:signal transduction histidine kinase